MTDKAAIKDRFESEEYEPPIEMIYEALVVIRQVVGEWHSAGHFAAIHREAMDWAVERAKEAQP